MKHFAFTLLTLIPAVCLNAQITMNPSSFLIGPDSLPTQLTFLSSDAIPFYYFDQSKGSIQAGFIGDEYWEVDSLGSTSMAMGFNAFAPGRRAFALGQNVYAGGEASISMGSLTESYGNDGSLALGYGSISSGREGSISLGKFAISHGDEGCIAIGDGSEVYGRYGNVAIGLNSMASGEDGSIAIGAGARSYGMNGSIAIGASSNSFGDLGSIAMGRGTMSNGDECVVVGRYNDTIVAKSTSVGLTSPLFIVGNGDPGVPSNAMVVLKNGNVGLGTNVPGAPLTIVGSNADNQADFSITSEDALFELGIGKSGPHGFAFGDETGLSVGPESTEDRIGK